MDSFLINALLAGWGVSFLCGPLGSLLLWRRMTFLGDTLNHGALLGVSLSLFIPITPLLGVLGVSFVMSGLIVWLHFSQKINHEVILNLLSYGTLSLGILLVSCFSRNSLDLSSYLFGDILACTLEDVKMIAGGGLFVMVFLGWQWSSLLLSLISPELAFVEGVPVKRMVFLFLCMISLVVALTSQMIGILLLGALLIAPAATAQHFSSSPEKMVFLSVLIGGFSISIGLFLSVLLNTPTSPTIVLTSIFVFFLSRLKEQFCF